MIICGAVNTHLTHPSVENGTPFKEWGALDGHPLRICNPCSEWALCTRREQLYGMKSTLYVPKISMHVCVCVYARTHDFGCVCVHSRAQHSNTHTQSWRVCVLRSLYWVVIVSWQCWVLLRREWRLRRRRRGRCWIDTDVCWPWQRCDTPSGSRSAPTHFLSSCPMLIVAWRLTQRE